MIGYWKEFFFDPTNPETAKFVVDYLTWMLYCYPIFLIQLPFVTLILFYTFKPEHRNISRAVVKLREQIRAQGPMKSADWVSIAAFAVILSGWMTFSDTLGLGTVAIFGAVAFLVIGLVRWEDLNSGVNWGVVLLYAAAISLGVQMKDSGAALWVANNFLDLLSPLGIEGGIPLWAAVSALTTGVTNTMSNGAAVAVIGPITLKMAAASGESPLLIGFITAISSAFAYLTVIGTPACTIVYASGYLKTTDFLPCRISHGHRVDGSADYLRFPFLAPDRVVGWRAKHRGRIRKPGSRHCAIQKVRRTFPGTGDPTRFSILVCIDGTDASYRALRHAVRIGSGTDADLTLLYVRPIDQGLRTGGMQISVVRENLLDWGLELPGAAALRRGRELLVELGWLNKDWQTEFAHVDVQGDPLGDNAIVYSSPKGRSIVLRLLIAPSVASGILDEAKLGEFDLLIVGMPEGEKGSGPGFVSRKIAKRVAREHTGAVLVTRNREESDGHLVCIAGYEGLRRCSAKAR